MNIIKRLLTWVINQFSSYTVIVNRKGDKLKIAPSNFQFRDLPDKIVFYPVNGIPVRFDRIINDEIYGEAANPHYLEVVDYLVIIRASYGVIGVEEIATFSISAEQWNNMEQLIKRFPVTPLPH